MRISDLCKKAHKTAKSKGFWDKERSVLGLLMLITTEVAECAEGIRKDGLDGNIAEELADTCIRIFDLAEAIGIDLEFAIAKKMESNKDRPMHHSKHFEEIRIKP